MAGIYLHIPYCKQACHYCNFHFSTSLKTKNDLTAALLKELLMRQDYLGDEPVDTVYFGGGTPSLLAFEDLQLIMEALREHFSISDEAEISFEANPDDLHPQQLADWKRAGINRLSIGIQSFFEEDLRWMNRAHSAAQAIDCIGLAHAAGFENISIDLIYGLPGLSDDRWIENIDRAIASGVPHLSCYALTVESKTALFKMIGQQKVPDVNADDQARQFLLLIARLEAAGYEHYEISSFAKPGRRSRHNTAYWQSKKYLGIGPSAHSYDGHSRQWNVANNTLYIAALRMDVLNFEREELQEKDVLNEYIMTALRTREGIDLGHVNASFGIETGSSLARNAAPYILQQKLRNENDRLFLTLEGKLFADGIAAGLFF